jgi:hypothetical protein
MALSGLGKNFACAATPPVCMSPSGIPARRRASAKAIARACCLFRSAGGKGRRPQPMGTRPASAACPYRASLFTPSEVAGPRRAACFFLVVAGRQTGAFVLVGARRGGLRPSCFALNSPHAPANPIALHLPDHPPVSGRGRARPGGHSRLDPRQPGARACGTAQTVASDFGQQHLPRRGSRLRLVLLERT